MPRYSNDGWANLLAAVDYKNEAPDREMKREASIMQLQALKDAQQKRTALESYRAGLDAPVAPETTAQVPDTVASAQTDPNALAQEQPTKEVPVPATFLNEDQKLEKMERYHALNGNWQEAKQINEYRKQEKQRIGFHQTFIQAYQMAGMDGQKTKEMLIQHYGEGARPQLENLEFTPGGVIQKKEGILTDWEGKIHNLPKESSAAPHLVTKTSPDGKYEQQYQYNPNAPGEDKYTIPIGDKHPVKNQVLSIDAQAKQDVGFKSWTPEAKQQEFMEHMITGTPPVNTRGLAGGDRQQYAKEFAQWKVDRGFTPQDAALMKTDYKAGDMSLKNMAKQEAPMSAFVLNINKQVNKLEELFKDADRSGLRLADLPLRDLRVKAKGSGKEAVLASYLLEVSNEIGKLSSGASASVQQLSDSAKEDWKKVHDVNLSPREIMYVLNATKDQANMRMTTWREAKQEVRKTMQFLGTDNSNLQPFDKPLPLKTKDGRDVKTLSDAELLKLLSGK